MTAGLINQESGPVEAGGPRGRRSLPRGLPFTLPLLAGLFISFNLPLIGVVGRSLGSWSDPTLSYYGEMLASPAYGAVLTNTFRVSAVVTAVAAILGYPLAYWIAGLKPNQRMVALTLVILPFWSSILVRTYSWIIILGFRGIVNETLLELGFIASPLQLIYNDLGVAVGMVHVLLPFLVLPLVAAMRGIDHRLLKAAASLGARPAGVFWRVFFPLTRPALMAGCILVFILGLGFFVTPAILGGGRVSMVATVLDTFINRIPRWELAAGLSVILLAVSLIFYEIYRRVGGIVR